MRALQRACSIEMIGLLSKTLSFKQGSKVVRVCIAVEHFKYIYILIFAYLKQLKNLSIYIFLLTMDRRTSCI